MSRLMDEFECKFEFAGAPPRASSCRVEGWRSCADGTPVSSKRTGVQKRHTVSVRCYEGAPHPVGASHRAPVRWGYTVRRRATTGRPYGSAVPAKLKFIPDFSLSARL